MLNGWRGEFLMTENLQGKNVLSVWKERYLKNFKKISNTFFVF
jgi:hypothetical protein